MNMAARMKSRTKAQKLRSKRARGRPRLPASDRQPNGQPSRRIASVEKFQQTSEADTMDVAVNRRIRQLGLQDYRDKGGRVVTAEEQAKDPRHGYVLGRMLLDHAITKDQHDTGIRLAEDFSRFYGLTGVPFPSSRAQDLFAVRSSGGEDSDGRANAARKARERAMALQGALLAVQDINTGRRVLHTVMQVCVLDVAESRGWPPHMTGWLRLGLNSVGKFYDAN